MFMYGGDQVLSEYDNGVDLGFEFVSMEANFGLQGRKRRAFIPQLFTTEK